MDLSNANFSHTEFSSGEIIAAVNVVVFLASIAVISVSSWYLEQYPEEHSLVILLIFGIVALLAQICYAIYRWTH